MFGVCEFQYFYKLWYNQHVMVIFHNNCFDLTFRADSGLIPNICTQLASKVNTPTCINTCNNRDYDLTEVCLNLLSRTQEHKTQEHSLDSMCPLPRTCTGRARLIRTRLIQSST